MGELNTLIINTMHKMLKARINAGIYCDVRDDDLFVRIKNDSRVWECCIENISRFMHAGYQLSGIARHVVDEYRKEVLSWYFY